MVQCRECGSLLLTIFLTSLIQVSFTDRLILSCSFRLVVNGYNISEASEFICNILVWISNKTVAAAVTLDIPRQTWRTGWGFVWPDRWKPSQCPTDKTENTFILYLLNTYVLSHKTHTNTLQAFGMVWCIIILCVEV